MRAIATRIESEGIRTQWHAHTCNCTGGECGESALTQWHAYTYNCTELRALAVPLQWHAHSCNCNEGGRGSLPPRASRRLVWNSLGWGDRHKTKKSKEIGIKNLKSLKNPAIVWCRATHTEAARSVAQCMRRSDEPKIGSEVRFIIFIEDVNNAVKDHILKEVFK